MTLEFDIDLKEAVEVEIDKPNFLHGTQKVMRTELSIYTDHAGNRMLMTREGQFVRYLGENTFQIIKQLAGV